MSVSQNHKIQHVKQEQEEPLQINMKSNQFFYQVQKILAMEKGKQNRYFYLVKWENWSIKDCTWEPEDNLEEVCDMVQSFLKARKQGKCDFNWRNFRSLVRLYNSNVRPTKTKKVAEPKGEGEEDFQGACKPSKSKSSKHSTIVIDVQQQISEENQKLEEFSRTHFYQSFLKQRKLFKKQVQSEQKSQQNNNQKSFVKQEEEIISLNKTVQQKEESAIILQEILEESQNIKLLDEDCLNNEKEQKVKIEQHRSPPEVETSNKNKEEIEVLQYEMNEKKDSLRYRIKENGVEKWIKPQEISYDFAISLVKFYEKKFVFK